MKQTNKHQGDDDAAATTTTTVVPELRPVAVSRDGNGVANEHDDERRVSSSSTPPRSTSDVVDSAPENDTSLVATVSTLSNKKKKKKKKANNNKETAVKTKKKKTMATNVTAASSSSHDDDSKKTRHNKLKRNKLHSNTNIVVAAATASIAAPISIVSTTENENTNTSDDIIRQQGRNLEEGIATAAAPVASSKKQRHHRQPASHNRKGKKQQKLDTKRKRNKTKQRVMKNSLTLAPGINNDDTTDIHRADTGTGAKSKVDDDDLESIDSQDTRPGAFPSSVYPPSSTTRTITDYNNSVDGHDVEAGGREGSGNDDDQNNQQQEVIIAEAHVVAEEPLPPRAEIVSPESMNMMMMNHGNTKNDATTPILKWYQKRYTLVLVLLIAIASAVTALIVGTGKSSNSITFDSKDSVNGGDDKNMSDDNEPTPSPTNSSNVTTVPVVTEIKPNTVYNWMKIGQDIDFDPINGYQIGYELALNGNDGSIVAVADPGYYTGHADIEGNEYTGMVTVYSNPKYEESGGAIATGPWKPFGYNEDNLDYSILHGGMQGVLYFASSIAISGEGTILAVEGDGIIFIYELGINNEWQYADSFDLLSSQDIFDSKMDLINQMEEENDFGGNVTTITPLIVDSIELSSDGKVIAVKSSLWCRIYRYGTEIQYNGWYLAKEVAGTSMGLSSDGNMFAVGTPFSQIWYYTYQEDDAVPPGNDQYARDSSDVIQLDGIAETIALSTDGSIIAAGISSESSQKLKVFQKSAWSYSQLGNTIEGRQADMTGHTISLSENGLVLALGEPNNDDGPGQVRIFRFNDEEAYIEKFNTNGGDWMNIIGESKFSSLQGKTLYEGFGYDIDLSYDGTRIAIGSIYAGEGGQVYVYQAVER